MYQSIEKEHNKSKFLSYLYFKKEVSIPKISHDLEFSYPTAKALVSNFLEEGLLVKSEEVAYQDKRKQAYFHINIL